LIVRKLATTVLLLAMFPASAQDIPESCIDSFRQLEEWANSDREEHFLSGIPKGPFGMFERLEAIRKHYGFPDLPKKPTGNCTTLCSREFIEAMSEDSLQAQLAAGHNVNELDQDGFTPLMKTLIGRTPEKAIWLLENGADPNIAGLGGDTALHIAASDLYSHQTLMLDLVEYGANTEAQNRAGYTPLATAITYGRPATVEMMLKAGADSETPNFFNDPPIFAIPYGFRDRGPRDGEKDYYSIFVNAGADINIRDEHGNTPINAVAGLGREAYVQILLSLGADSSIPGRFGLTPYCSAIFTGQLQNPELLERLRLGQ